MDKPLEQPHRWLVWPPEGLGRREGLSWPGLRGNPFWGAAAFRLHGKACLALTIVTHVQPSTEQLAPFLPFRAGTPAWRAATAWSRDPLKPLREGTAVQPYICVPIYRPGKTAQRWKLPHLGRRAKQGTAKGPSPSGKCALPAGESCVHLQSTRFLDFYSFPSFHRFPHFVCSTESGSE